MNDDRQIEQIKKKLETAHGGMKTILEGQLQHHDLQESRRQEEIQIKEKILADNERIRKAALATWDKKPEGEDTNK